MVTTTKTHILIPAAPGWNVAVFLSRGTGLLQGTLRPDLPP